MYRGPCKLHEKRLPYVPCTEKTESRDAHSKVGRVRRDSAVLKLGPRLCVLKLCAPA